MSESPGETPPSGTIIFVLLNPAATIASLKAIVHHEGPQDRSFLRQFHKSDRTKAFKPVAHVIDVPDGVVVARALQPLDVIVNVILQLSELQNTPILQT
jgi:hypothetical protein